MLNNLVLKDDLFLDFADIITHSLHLIHLSSRLFIPLSLRSELFLISRIFLADVIDSFLNCSVDFTFDSVNIHLTLGYINILNPDCIFGFLYFFGKIREPLIKLFLYFILICIQFHIAFFQSEILMLLFFRQRFEVLIQFILFFK
jgi:hypothetical protein